MVKAVANMEGVYLAKFDFCQLGMTTRDEDGEEAAARKRTGVLTNSKNIAEALRVAQCTGAHKHVHLINGRAGPCQKYPDKFVKLICAGIQKEVEDLKWRDKTLKDLDITQAINSQRCPPCVKKKIQPAIHETRRPLVTGREAGATQTALSEEICWPRCDT